MLVRSAASDSCTRTHKAEIAPQVVRRDGHCSIRRLRHLHPFHVARLSNGQINVAEASPHELVSGVPDS